MTYKSALGIKRYEYSVAVSDLYTGVDPNRRTLCCGDRNGDHHAIMRNGRAVKWLCLAHGCKCKTWEASDVIIEAESR